MDELKKIEQELEEIEQKIEEGTQNEWEVLQNRISKRIKYLIGMKNYYQKQKGKDLNLIRGLIKKGKKLEQRIINKKENLEQESVSISKNKIKEDFIREEEQELIEISKMGIDSLEKINLIEKKIKKIKNHIEFLKRKIKRIGNDEKEFKANKIRITKLKKQNRNVETKVLEGSLNQFYLKKREILTEISYQKHILSLYQSLVAQLNSKEIEAKYFHKKEESTKQENENKYYYCIIYSLLSDDKNYLFLKEILQSNSNFINARYNGHPIVFLILDFYIENLKLEMVNQKLVHKNPNFYYSLLKLFKNPSLNLSKEEKQYIEDRIKDLKEYLKNRSYEEDSDKMKKVDALLEENKPLNKEEISIPMQTEQEYLNSVALSNHSRVDLRKEHLEKVKELIAKQQILNENKNGTSLSELELMVTLKLPICDIRNSEIPVDTLAIEGTKYAISFGYSKKYELYFRVHVLDTTSLYEQSPSLKEIQCNFTKATKQVKKALKFRIGNSYPVITYQLKLSQGKVLGFQIYESVIKIDSILTNEEIKNYRSNFEVKNLIGYLILLRNNYNLFSLEMNGTNIEKILDYVINKELKEYVAKYNLPILYYTELEMEEYDKVQLHNRICYYLSKISKKESDQIFKTLEHLKVNRYYGFVPLEESKIEFDTRNKIGYLNSDLIKCRLHGIVSGPNIESIRNSLNDGLMELQQEDLFIDYFNERKLIRQLKKEEIEEKQRLLMDEKRRKKESANKSYE